MDSNWFKTMFVDDVKGYLKKNGVAVSGDQVSQAVEKYLENNQPDFEYKIKAVKNENCMIIAHRGYFVNVPENTIAAVNAAIENGFDWVEIDINRCADGTYILSHDINVTLYNKGIAEKVSFNSVKYSDIKDYTWDSEGMYRVDTLMALFVSTKCHNVKFVCDLYSGKNVDVMTIASLAGVTDSVMLTYYSTSSAIMDIELLKKYSNVPIRVVPNGYAELKYLMEHITNPIYAALNADNEYRKQVCIPISLACGIPMLFAGCTDRNLVVWKILSAGCMSIFNNFSYEDFCNMLSIEYTSYPSAPYVDKNSVEIVVGAEESLNVATEEDGPEGYTYAYSLDPNVVAVKQITFGTKVELVVLGLKEGVTSIRIFNGSGMIIDIPVHVVANESPTNNSFTIGCQLLAYDIPYIWPDAKRALYSSDYGETPLTTNEISVYRYPILLPDNATKMTLNESGWSMYVIGLKNVDGVWRVVSRAGWIQAGSQYNIPQNVEAVVCNLNNSEANIDSIPDTLNIVFS